MAASLADPRLFYCCEGCRNVLFRWPGFGDFFERFEGWSHVYGVFKVYNKYVMSAD